jgi:pimeloyl-ACP methyl ester carboxylesterase
MARLPVRHGGRGRRIAIHGLHLYYEVHGSGPPLVILHGALATIDAQLGSIIPVLARSRRVIAVELQGHGRTADIERPLRHDALADDVAALIRHLDLGRTDVVGVCLGGGVALQIAVRHPDLVRSLVIASAPCRSDGWSPRARAEMAALDGRALLGSPLHAAYLRVAPRPDDWPRLVSRLRALVVDERYDWTAAMAAIRAPALILVGDADRVRVSHAVEMFERLGGADDRGDSGPRSQLVVLPGTGHGGVLARTDILGRVLPAFLDAPVSMIGDRAEVIRGVDGDPRRLLA